MQRLRQRYHYSVILLRELVRTDFKLRYQGSVLGYLWSLLRPLLLFLILYVVFTKFLKVGNTVPHYPVYLLLGIVLWNYFTEVTGGAVGVIVGKGDLLRKINFPKYVIVLSGSLSALINLSLNFIIIAIFMYFDHVHFLLQDFLILPFIFELFVFSIALAFFLSAAFVHFRDLSYIWEVLVQAGFYATPILYPLSRIPAKYAKFVLLNPLAQIIQDCRHILVTPASPTIYQLYGHYWPWAIPIGITILAILIAGSYFRKQSHHFAEDV